MRILGLLVAVLLALTACGGEAEPKTKTAPNGDKYTTADVAFAQQMIQHHAQALVLVDMLHKRQVSPELAELGEGILSSQTAEIETMTTWLTDWEEEIPPTVRDHVNAGHGDDGHDHGSGEDTGAGMPGMLSDEQMSEIEKAQGAEFEKLWAQGMIEHHEGAIEMAEEQIDNGGFKPALELAHEIANAQQAEIKTLEQLASS